MRTWFLAEDNGNVLALTADRPPAWFAWNQGSWCDTRSEAVQTRRRALAYSVESAEKAMESARASLAAFDAATEGGDS